MFVFKVTCKQVAMRSASSADRSAICVTFSLPHENAVELQNMANSCAGRLRELGVLAVQVGNSTAISLQQRTGNTCRSVDHAGTSNRQQMLNATRTNIAHYLGTDISTFPSVVGSGSAAENEMQNNAVCHENVMSITSASSGVAKNVVAESSPHIVNLLQHDIISSRSVCLSSPMPMSSVSDVRPRKRARRRTPSSAADVSVPLSMFGTADCTNSVYSFQQPSRSVGSSTGVPSVHDVPAEQFKIPESRKKRAGSSRKTAAAKSQQLPVPMQAPSNNLTNSFNVAFSECSKSSDVGTVFHPTSSYSIGDRFQINGVNPYHQIPVMTTGWQTYTTRSVPSNGLYQSLAATAQYQHEYGRHPRFHVAGNVDYSQATVYNRVPDIGSYHNVTPGSSVVFVSDVNQMRLKEEHAPCVVPTQLLRWSSETESKSASVPYGSNNSSLVPSVYGVSNMTHNNSRGVPMSHIVQQQFVVSQSDGSKPFTESGTSAIDKTVHLPLSSRIDRIKNVPVCGAPNISSLSGGHVNMPPSVSFQRANGLFADVHGATFVYQGHAAHVKMNGDVDCLQHANSQAPLKHEAVFEKLTAVAVPPYAPLASSLPTCSSDTHCIPERQLQQLADKVQHCGLANFDDTGLSGCSANMSDVSKLSETSGMVVYHEPYIM